MVQVFITGGTVDKQYNYIDGRLYFGNSHLPDMLERGRSTVPVNITTLMMIDSLEMTDDDRQIILHNCQKSRQQRILITHGTDTMTDTARYLALGDTKDKTIVLVGALVPYAFGNSSDGFFNLGAALAFVQLLPPGVYIAMNGQYHKWDEVRKNRRTGYFEIVEEG